MRIPAFKGNTLRTLFTSRLFFCLCSTLANSASGLYTSAPIIENITRALVLAHSSIALTSIVKERVAINNKTTITNRLRIPTTVAQSALCITAICSGPSVACVASLAALIRHHDYRSALALLGLSLKRAIIPYALTTGFLVAYDYFKYGAPKYEIKMESITQMIAKHKSSGREPFCTLF